MLECWNIGMMGSKEFLATKIELFCFYNPMFHCSNIPSFHVDRTGNVQLKDP
jgi:hypothetical protein